jgi:hypothetical protein
MRNLKIKMARKMRLAKWIGFYLLWILCLVVRNFLGGKTDFSTIQAGGIGLRQFSFPSSIDREPNVVFPRVITPNGDGINYVVFFLFRNETDAPVKGTIYDLKSAKVVDLQIGSFYTGIHTLLVWDGRDESGAVVGSGIYIYKVDVGDNHFTGTVAVLR